MILQILPLPLMKQKNPERKLLYMFREALLPEMLYLAVLPLLNMDLNWMMTCSD